MIEIKDQKREELWETLKMSAKYKKIYNEHHTNDFNFEVKDGNLILELKTPELRYAMYCADLLEYNYKEIKKIDIDKILYSQEKNDSIVFDNAKNFTEYVATSQYDYNDPDDIVTFVCYIIQLFQNYFIDQIKSLSDIDRELNLGLYMSIYNKLNEKKDVSIELEGITYTGTLKQLKVKRVFFSVNLIAVLSIISFNGEKYVEHDVDLIIPKKEKIKSIEDLEGITILTEDKINKYTARGKKYVKYTEKPSYINYDGYGYEIGYYGNIRTHVSGRFMSDIKNFREMNAFVEDRHYNGIFSNSAKPVNIDESNIWKCSPILYGFSFVTKTWMQILIQNATDIKFSEEAFNELVIDPMYKDIIVAALTNRMPSLDSITGKGNGKIFLLFGSAGSGKTMTAESVAEFLHKPLYFVSVGELGTTPEKLEEKLDQVMKIASSWDAVILFDEVDAFVTKRDSMNLERNAMTAIFLRLLERYNGIMFMTTNLEQNLDEAFISRCTASIQYDELTADVRKTIWENILNKAKVAGYKVDQEVYNKLSELSENKLNGRTIKNIIRLSAAYAESKNSEIKYSHINQVIKLNKTI